MLMYAYCFDAGIPEAIKSYPEFNSLISILRQITKNGFLVENNHCTFSNLVKWCNSLNENQGDLENTAPDIIWKLLDYLEYYGRIVSRNGNSSTKCNTSIGQGNCPRNQTPVSDFTVTTSNYAEAACRVCGTTIIPIMSEQFVDKFAGKATVTSWLIGDEEPESTMSGNFGRIQTRVQFRTEIWKPFLGIKTPNEITIYDRNIGRLYLNNKSNNYVLGNNYIKGIEYFLEEVEKCASGRLPRILIKTELAKFETQNFSKDKKKMYRRRLYEEICKATRSYRGDVELRLPDIDENGNNLQEMLHSRFFHSETVTLQSDTGLDLLKYSQRGRDNELLLRNNIMDIRSNFVNASVVDIAGWRDYQNE